MSSRKELKQELSQRRTSLRSLLDDESSSGVSSSRRRRPRSKVTVKPKYENSSFPGSKTHHHPEWLPLTNLDRVVNPTFISVIFFYEYVLGNEGNDAKTFQDVTASLKASLAKVLVEFYPLAGRLTLKEDGLVDLHCNDAGAIFVETSVNYELSQLGGPQPMPLLSGMDVMDHVARVGSGHLYIPDELNPEIPVLVIAVTRFACGSIAVAANWHHTVADGFSGCHFMRSWGQVTTGQGLSLVPSHDRHLLKPRSPPDASLVQALVHSRNYGSRRKFEHVQVPVREDSPSGLPYPVTLKSFILKKDTVQRLKEEVNRDTEVGEKRPFTSTETVSAELWRLMTKARSADGEEVRRDTSRFFMFVDGRKRLGLPTGYFGNVVCSACAESPQDELLRRPLSYAASLISNATRAIDKEYFRSLIDWVEDTGLTSPQGCQSEHVYSTGLDVAATFWTFFPLYEISFGWGKPTLSVRNAPPRKSIDGIAMMPGPDDKGNIVALLNLHTDRMDKLERDPGFKKTAELLHMKTSCLDFNAHCDSVVAC